MRPFRVRRVFQAYGAIVHNRSVAAFHVEQRVVQPVRDRPEAENALDGATRRLRVHFRRRVLHDTILCDDDDDVSNNNNVARVCVFFTTRDKRESKEFTLKEKNKDFTVGNIIPVVLNALSKEIK